MLDDRAFRHLLLADVALVSGAVKAHDVAAAIQLYWGRRDTDPVSLADELARIAAIPRQALRPLEAEVDRLIADAGGDARVALTRQGGIDRSIHATLADQGAGLSMLLTEAGARARPELRPLSVHRYLDFKVAGQGGMGIVYLALDTDLSRRVAFKMIRPDARQTSPGDTPATPLEAVLPAAGSPASRTFDALKARFLQEAWVTGGLEHPGIVPVYELGQTPGGIPYYTMRFIRGDRTLKDALDGVRIGPVEDRLSLLEPFLKACDAMAYAHARGVIHRDLKPSNIALGEYGEAVLLDWGLAKLEGQEDQAASRWQERVRTFRESADVRTLGAAGTPGYMPPEAALGRLDETDARSDVFSLGVMLYEILTGKLPHPLTSYADYVAHVTQRDARPAREIERDVPETLSDLAGRCLSRSPPDRPGTVAEVAASVRAWQAASAVEREVEGHLRDARTALEAAESARGSARLAQVERAAAAEAQAAAKRPEHPGCAGLRERIEALRDSGIRERERTRSRRLLVRAGVLGLALAAVAAVVVAGALEKKRQEADRARVEMERERNAKAKALDDVLRLSDAKVARDLVVEADRLWPIHPDRAPDMAAWLAAADELRASREKHEARRARLRAQAIPAGDGSHDTWKFEDRRDAWMHEVLSGLLADLDRTTTLYPEIESRHRGASLLRTVSIENHEAAWQETIDGIEASDRYGGRRLTPQVGLIPLGPDPDSGLYEFAHVGSGTVPARDPVGGKLVREEDFAVVLVLIPGGTFRMGAQKANEGAPNFDPWATSTESPLREVTLSPYFMAKYECTQSQWRSLTGGSDPSDFSAGARVHGQTVTPRNPVEHVSWEDCMHWLPRWGLDLPSEAQWEYACRAGTATPWFSGQAATSLAGVANIADEHLYRHLADSEQPYALGVDDGHGIHAPVGSYAPNTFGLHDTHGNVQEWCADTAGRYAPGRPVTDPVARATGSRGRICRGGAWFFPATEARSAGRAQFDPATRGGTTGCRPARALADR